jgi:carboxypeptidase C (cathepsin A)
VSPAVPVAFPPGRFKLATSPSLTGSVTVGWKLDPSVQGGTTFLTSLCKGAGVAVGAYDGRVTANDTGIAGSVSPNSGGNDPTITAVGGVYTAMWNVYLNEELLFTFTSPFMDLNDKAFSNWDFSHVDPTGTERGSSSTLYTAGDLAAAMELNPYLRVFSANGYYDAVTPFFQTSQDLDNMPLGRPDARQNLEIHNYPSGHMIYLDDASRSLMKLDLSKFYGGMGGHYEAVQARRREKGVEHVGYSRYGRRFGRAPY